MLGFMLKSPFPETGLFALKTPDEGGLPALPNISFLFPDKFGVLSFIIGYPNSRRDSFCKGGLGVSIGGASNY